ncbi:hypothetical protein HY061_00110 [Candidatus Azambacteria bacterium]|nr:hypothetical protein [Candidatus Azambacteria bacterium]
MIIKDKKKKGEKIEKILNLLQGGAEMTASLLDVFLCDYNTSYKKMRKVMSEPSTSYFKTNWAEAYRERQQFYNILNKLKKSGLISKKEINNSSKWFITKNGLEKLQILKTGKMFDIHSADYSWYKKESSEFCIVIFDIPEDDRHKRRWIRSALISLDFMLLQNSVWIGKNSIPEQFIHDLKEKKMLDYVHIFGVGDQGTIEKLFSD